ncbi:protein FAR-RED IMPAIRED RESPONSE 1-like [Silene latifolia]|uniref:protein FAR-RED IMPAIRED RESPONSE 1-like n=1 Tax=Silene latifolia TaxID=37657 RepID=UPI003D7711B9
MIFAPFTGVDNHKKCVAFAAGLLRNESNEGFAWLFQSFLTAMGGKYPKCIITDQDAGIKAGVKKVFKDKTHHRYCMWHIMKKLPDKIGSTLYRETNFMKEICSCVWAEDIVPAEFEERWCSVISSYGLTENEWLTSMFDMRASWIPAYFRNLFLGELMRTTSRSESENSFFGNFMNPNLTLVEFLMRFEILWNAACFTCGVKVLGVDITDNIPIHDHERNKIYYKNKLGNLWSEVFSRVTIEEQKPEYIDELMDILKGFKDMMLSDSSSSECSSGVTCEKSRNKNKELEMLLGTKIQTEVSVLNPIQSKTKGSEKRMVSQKDKAVQEHKKAPRKYNACGELGFHDSRNCPGRA